MIPSIFLPLASDSEEVTAARELYASTKDPTGALKLMPKWKALERQLLQGLEIHAERKNYLGALSFVSLTKSPIENVCKAFLFYPI